MYIELIRQVVDAGVRNYAASSGESTHEVLTKTRGFIDQTAKEYRKAEPNINYNDVLCRLGYLYRHGAANATLFERVLAVADEVWPRKTGDNPQTVNVCALGGGPGTELLGMAKYLIHREHLIPSNIRFTLLDNVLEWAETWQDISKRVSAHFSRALGASLVQPPVIASSFLQFDVLDETSYKHMTTMFSEADIVICNYLFSENKTRLDRARVAIERLAQLTPSTCAFVVIDRFEHQSEFLKEVVHVFESVFGDKIRVEEYDGTLNGDERVVDFGDELFGALGYPRITFHTPQSRKPTVFWFVVKQRAS